MAHYFDSELIRKYHMSGPRYTSYPTAVQFTDAFAATDYVAQLKASNASGRALSLYVHIPFCEQLCYFCACNKIITRNHRQVEQYLHHLALDIAWQAEHIDHSRKVIQLHFGGGTPTFLSADELAGLLERIHRHFAFVPDSEGEFSIEVDPRTVDRNYLARLRALGFNRISFGVQDFNPEVQKAINRVQPREQVATLIENARTLGYHSISVDLIYGLPLQTVERFARTVEEMIALSPDRLAVFNYAHMPHLFGAQKQINTDELPSAATKLEILETTIKQLTECDYEFIGLDHFAKSGDSLVQHQKKGTLYRNFQGYSTFSNCDLLGFGVSAISQVADCYSQHEKARSKYYAAIDDKRLPVARGVTLTPDDKIRREAITEIMCNLRLNLDALSQKYVIDAPRYFARECRMLPEMAADGLLTLEGNRFIVHSLGRLLIRNIAMVFDGYLQKENPQRFSQVI